VALLPDYRLPEIEVRVLFPSARHVSAKLRAMVDFLVQAFAGDAPWDPPAAPRAPRARGLART